MQHNNSPTAGYPDTLGLQEWSITMEESTLVGNFKHIRSVPTTVKNPQLNAIIERLHQTMGDILRVMLHINPSNDKNDANQIVDNALATCVYSSRYAVNHTMQTSPGALVFQWDMMMNVPLIANVYIIQQRRQQLINENLRRNNARRIQHKYSIG